jgi:hypothetical protein
MGKNRDTQHLHLSLTFRVKGRLGGRRYAGGAPECQLSYPSSTSTESEEELGEELDLSALFSACTSTDAYRSVSVRDLLSFIIYLTSSFSSFMLFTGLSVY